MRSLLIFFTIAFLFTFCSAPKEFRFDELTIVTKNSESLSSWYSKNFGFMESKDHSLLYHDDLTIKLIQNTEAKHRDSVEYAYNVKYLPGIFKFGFKTNQFDDLLTHLKKNEVRFEGSILKDSILNKRMVILKDPESNLIQIFEDNASSKLAPYFIGIIAQEIGEQEKWYQMHFPVKETHILDIPDQDVFIRLLTGPDATIEIIQPEETRIKDELNYAQITGFYSIAITGAGITFDHDKEGNFITNTPKN